MRSYKREMLMKQCLLCCSRDISIIQLLEEDKSRYFCTACTGVFIWPTPDRKKRETLYNEEYYTTGIMKGYQFTNMREHYRMMRHHLPEFMAGQRLLDLGCATGQYLIYAGQEGIKSEGIDISSYAVDVCREKGLKVYCGTLGEVLLPDAAFNWIIARDIIEHVIDPIRFLERIDDRLTPGGILSLYASDLSYYGEREVVMAQIPEEHPFLFNYALLAKLTNRHFEILSVERFKIYQNSPHGFRTLITSRKPAKGSSPEKWINNEIPQKYYDFEQKDSNQQNTFRIKLRLFLGTLDKHSHYQWLLLRTGAIWQIDDFLNLFSEHRPRDSIDLLVQESNSSYFTHDKRLRHIIPVPDGRLDIEIFSDDLMERLKNNCYHFLTTISRNYDIEGYENVIDLMKLFQNVNGIIFNNIGSPVYQQNFKKNLYVFNFS